MTDKRCSSCGLIKPLSEFPLTNEPYHADGHKHRCNVCTAAYNQEYQLNRRNRTISKEDALKSLEIFIEEKGKTPIVFSAYLDLLDTDTDSIKVQRLEHLKGRINDQIARETTVSKRDAIDQLRRLLDMAGRDYDGILAYREAQLLPDSEPVSMKKLQLLKSQAKRQINLMR